MTDHPITTDEELIKEIEAQKAHMIAVATGGARPSDWNRWPDEERKYAERLRCIQEALQKREIPDTNPHENLMAWYGKWSGGDLPTYHSRRQYVSELLDPLIKAVRQERTHVFEEPTGWAKVDRQIESAREQLARAKHEEHYQEVGLICREVLISLAQEVYDPDQHQTEDGVVLSSTDTSNSNVKAMLEAYLRSKLSGEKNKAARKYTCVTTSAALDFANALQHKRTANFHLAAMCAEATNSIVNMIDILSGRRGP